jgi:hypothetical protein
MSIVLQLLVVAIAATGIAWAIASDYRVATARTARGTETAGLARRPWASYGMLGVSGGLFLISAEMALFGLGWVQTEGGATAVIGTLLMVVGSFVFLYGLVDKYLIHRGRPAQSSRWVHALIYAFIAGFILLPLAGVLGASSQQPPESPNAAEGRPTSVDK